MIVDYPQLPLDRSSSCEARPNVTFDLMADKTVSGRVDSDGVAYDITLVHTFMTHAQAASIRQHFRDHKTDTIRIEWAGDFYEGGYVGEPSVQKINGIWRTVTSRFVANLASELDAFQLQTGEFLLIGGETLE